jgi:hypothetical protein
MNTTNTIPTAAEIKAEILNKQKEIRACEAQFYQLGYKNVDQAPIIAARKLAKKEKYKTTNGLTVENLRKAGHKVKVVHVRYTAFEGVKVLVPVPSFLRGVAKFTAFGGATHIVITTPASDSPDIAVSSVCHTDDCFDYRLGVKRALDEISQDEATLLLSGIALTAQAATA